MIMNSLGFIAVATPGVPVQAVVAVTRGKQVKITPMKSLGVANTGNVYFGTSALNRTSGVGVMGILRPGDAAFPIYQGDSLDTGGMDLSTIYVDANTAADGVLISYIT